MDLISIERIKLLHPLVRNEVLEAYQHTNNMLLGKKLRLRFSHTLRSFKEQNELYDQGRSRPGKIVTNAKAGYSIHNYGLAFDIVLLVDKNGDGIFETASWDITADFDNDRIADWMEVVYYFKNIGWTWGGDWKSFPDFPHFEKTFGLTPKKLFAKHLSGDTFQEIIDGKTYNWVNL